MPISKRPYHIVADRFSTIGVRVHNPELYVPSPEDQKRIDAFVDSQTKRAKERGGAFYDGDMIGVPMNSFKTERSELSFDTRRLRYFQHAGVNRWEREAPIQAAYVNGLLITKDNRLVCGLSQVAEPQWLGTFGIPAGSLNLGPDGFPSMGAQIYREISEEVGIVPDYQIIEIVPGWINGASKREKTYSLTTSFVVPLKMNEAEARDYFEGWKAAQEKWMSSATARGEKMKTEFKRIHFLPNDPNYLQEDTIKKGGVNIQGKSMDVVQEWAEEYGCDLERLKESKKSGARIFLPQPRI